MASNAAITVEDVPFERSCHSILAERWRGYSDMVITQKYSFFGHKLTVVNNSFLFRTSHITPPANLTNATLLVSPKTVNRLDIHNVCLKSIEINFLNHIWKENSLSGIPLLTIFVGRISSKSQRQKTIIVCSEQTSDLFSTLTPHYLLNLSFWKNDLTWNSLLFGQFVRGYGRACCCCLPCRCCERKAFISGSCQWLSWPVSVIWNDSYFFSLDSLLSHRETDSITIWVMLCVAQNYIPLCVQSATTCDIPFVLISI